MQRCEHLVTTARRLLLDALQPLVLSETLNLDGCYLQLRFRDGSRLFVTYNNHHEYSYQYLYSRHEYDRERFDNYDREWPVPSRPHHFHVRGRPDVLESPMTGDPQQDMLRLVDFLKKRLQ